MNEEESYKHLQSIFSNEEIEKRITATIIRMNNLINREAAIYIILKEKDFDFDTESFRIKDRYKLKIGPNCIRISDNINGDEENDSVPLDRVIYMLNEYNRIINTKKCEEYHKRIEKNDK